MPDSPVSAISFRDSVALRRVVWLLRFSFGRTEREKTRTIGLFKLQVPVEKCLSTWATRGACIRKVYTPTAALLRLTSGRTTNANRKTRNRDPDCGLKIKLNYCPGDTSY